MWCPFMVSIYVTLGYIAYGVHLCNKILISEGNPENGPARHLVLGTGLYRGLLRYRGHEPQSSPFLHQASAGRESRTYRELISNCAEYRIYGYIWGALHF